MLEISKLLKLKMSNLSCFAPKKIRNRNRTISMISMTHSRIQWNDVTKTPHHQTFSFTLWFLVYSIKISITHTHTHTNKPAHLDPGRKFCVFRFVARSLNLQQIFVRFAKHCLWQVTSYSFFSEILFSIRISVAFFICYPVSRSHD